MPEDNCCTEELMLMNPPRYRGSMLEVSIAMAGTDNGTVVGSVTDKNARHESPKADDDVTP